MFLETSDKKGDVSVRTVLLNSYNEKGFVFYTNYMSRKSQQIKSNPNASLCIY